MFIKQLYFIILPWKFILAFNIENIDYYQNLSASMEETKRWLGSRSSSSLSTEKEKGRQRTPLDSKPLAWLEKGNNTKGDSRRQHLATRTCTCKDMAPLDTD